MNEKKLDSILACIRAEEPPTLPSGFQDEVWREIRRRKKAALESKSGWLEELLVLLFRPQTAMAALVLSIGVGVGMATFSMRDAAIEDNGLEMSVFGSKPPGLPSTLLTRN